MDTVVSGAAHGLTEKMAESLDPVRVSHLTQDVMESFFKFLRFQLANADC